jgi:CheY-like chemotaxis protein
MAFGFPIRLARGRPTECKSVDGLLLLQPALIAVTFKMPKKDRVRGEAAPRLLLIDDNADLAQATGAFLRLYGFDVQIVRTGRESIEVAAAFVPEIVLCDLFLPDMSGFDVARELRIQPATECVLFAMHSAMRESEIGMSAAQLRAASVDLFLSKPITSAMIETLRRRREENRNDRTNHREL